jgi:CHASE2 domain-containing sensor protein
MRLIAKVTLALVLGLSVVAVLASGVTPFLRKLASPDGATIVSVLLRNHHSTAIPVTIVDIDAATHQAWGAPAITPRDKLYALIDKISALGPIAIVVDIDLAATPARDVASLTGFLGQRRGADRSSLPDLLLVRRLAPGDDRNAASALLSQIDPRIEAAVRGATNVQWVSALVIPEDDATVRQWRAFHALCAEAPPRALPSIALAVETLRRAGPKDNAVLEPRLREEAAKVCSGTAVSHPALIAPRIPDYAIPVPYMFGWSSESAPYFQTTDTPSGRRPLLVRMSARDVDAAPVLARDPFERRVVLIGASHPDSQDFRRTPLGTMPGVYILANIVAGARDMLDARFSPRTTILLFAVPLFLVCAFVGLMTRSIAGIPLVATIVILAAVIGLLMELPPFVIHEGAISALGALVAVLAVTQAWQVFSKLTQRNGKSVWRGLILSETGNWLYDRLSGGRSDGTK